MSRTGSRAIQPRSTAASSPPAAAPRTRSSAPAWIMPATRWTGASSSRSSHTAEESGTMRCISFGWSTLLVIATVAAVVLTALCLPGRAAGRLPAGKLVFDDPQFTNCYYRNQFFDKDVRAAFGLHALDGSKVDPPSGAYRIGRFA